MTGQQVSADQTPTGDAFTRARELQAKYRNVPPKRRWIEYYVLGTGKKVQVDQITGFARHNLGTWDHGFWLPGRGA